MSTLLRDKAILNFAAANILKEWPNYHYCSSIHCSYYYCFQVVKYIVVEIYKVNDGSIYSLRREDPARQKTEHEYVIEYLYRKLIEKSETIGASAFKNKMFELKCLRTNADYKDIPIDKPTSDKAYNLAIEVAAILKKSFRYEYN